MLYCLLVVYPILNIPEQLLTSNLHLIIAAIHSLHQIILKLQQWFSLLVDNILPKLYLRYDLFQWQWWDTTIATTIACDLLVSHSFTNVLNECFHPGHGTNNFLQLRNRFYQKHRVVTCRQAQDFANLTYYQSGVAQTQVC